jgi:hypothetical protein
MMKTGQACVDTLSVYKDICTDYPLELDAVHSVSNFIKLCHDRATAP